MAPQKEYRWVEHKARASKISPESWKYHEPTIRELHPTKSLQQLMDHMKETYEFAPSRHQYICQLKEWKLGKYRTGIMSAIPKASHLTATGKVPRTNISAKHSLVLQGVETHADTTSIQSTPSTAICDFDVHLGALVGDLPKQYKRPRDLASIRSSTSSSVLLTRPPTKKGRHGPSQDGLPTGQTTTSTAVDDVSPPSDPQQWSSDDNIGEVAETEKDVDEMHKQVLQASKQSSDDLLQAFAQPPFRSSFPPRQVSRTSFQTQQSFRSSFPPQQLSFPSQWTSGDEMSKICRTFTNHRISTFMEQDYSNIEIAVEYMEALERHEDAFALHIILLRRNLTRDPSDTREHLIRMIKCSRCISKPEHFDLVHHHLQHAFERLRGRVSSNRVEIFLVNMALAEMHIRRYDTELAKTYILYARGSAGQFQDAAQLMSGLPQDDRSLDLVLYYYFQVDLGYQSVLTWEQLAPWFRRVPGPFELKHDCSTHGYASCPRSRERGASDEKATNRVQVPCNESLFIHSSCLTVGYCEVDEGGLRFHNPCIRSCLLWCGLVIRFGEGADLDFWTSCVAHEESQSDPSDHPKRAFKALFTKLLSLWMEGSLVLDLPTRTLEDVAVWQTRGRIGISPAMLLRITCGYINKESFGNPSERGEPAPVRLAIAKLLRSPDTQLAHHFLDELTQSRRSVAQSEWNSVTAELEAKRHIGVDWLLENRELAFVRPIMAAAACPAPVVTEDTTHTKKESKTYAGVISGRSVTMASSRGSSDKSLMSFRGAGKRVTATMSKLKEQAPVGLSWSEYSTGSMTSTLSVRSGMDALSDRFKKTSLVATVEEKGPGEDHVCLTPAIFCEH